MNAICIDLIPKRSRVKIQNGLRASLTMQPFGPWLCHGEEVSVYYTRLKPNSWPEHNHRHAELLLTFDSAQVEIAWRTGAGCSKQVSVGAHQFCLIPPNVPHACEWKREANVVVVFFGESLLKTQVRQPLGSVVVGDFRPLTRLDASLWSLGAIFHDLCHKTDRPAATFIEGIGAALASRTLELHFQASRRRLRSQPGLSDPVLHRVVTHIDAHLHEPLTVADMARNAAMGVDHFARLLKNTTGISPLQFLLKCRVEKALELLRTGKFRVGEVACQVGFYDQSHLDRQCRKFFGCAPKTAMTAPERESSLKMPETSKIS
jgi:AraC family transcriptional regulator